MPTPPITDEELLETVRVWRENGRSRLKTAMALNRAKSTIDHRLTEAARRGYTSDDPAAWPGFHISRVSNGPRGRTIEQKPEHGEPFEVPPGHHIKGVSTLVDASGNKVIQWVKTREDDALAEAKMRAVVDAFKEDLPRAEPVAFSGISTNDDLLNQYTVTDMHFGMLSWREETGADYDLKIAERLLLDWFTAAVRLAPDASTAVFAQLGDLLHHDSHLSVTPTHGNVLDADSRLQKMIRIVIRTVRKIVALLLEKHQRVHLVMADANHDPAGGAWLREMFAAFFEDEPRLTVDNSASTFYAYEFGLTSLFYHHGHRRKISTIDGVLAGKFREIFGRTKYSYAHLGHLHSDEMRSMSTTMKVEQHETLAAPDAFAANGGWLSGRSAKVITYSKRFGEVGRLILKPEMVSQ